MGLFDYLERRSKTHNENEEAAAGAQTPPLGADEVRAANEDARAANDAPPADSDENSSMSDSSTSNDASVAATDEAATEDDAAASADDAALLAGETLDAASGDDTPSDDAGDSPADSSADSPATPADDTADSSIDSPDTAASEDDTVSSKKQAKQAEKARKQEAKQAAKQAKQEAKQQAKQAKQTPQGKHAAGIYNPPTITDAENFPAIPHKKKHPVLKGIGIAACSIVVLAALVYGAGVFVFSNRILPNTTIVEQDISLNSNDQVVQLLESVSTNYSIEAKCGTFSFKATQADLGLDMNIAHVIDNIHARYDPLKWPLYVFEPARDVSDALNIQFDPSRYRDAFVAAIEEFNTHETAPTNAFIYYDEATKKFLVQNEVAGTQLDPTRSLESFGDGIKHLQPIVRLTEKDLIQPSVLGSDERLIESARLATGLISAHITLTINGSPVRTLTSDELSSSIAINDNFEVAFNDEYLNNLCSTIAESFNTVGTERTYTRADGKEITVSGGDAGWEVDAEELSHALLDAIKRAETTSIEVPLLQRGYVIAEPGQRDWPNRYIDVDLSEQHVRFYDDNGALFWETDCITGRPDGMHNTPQGVWSINAMKSPSKLRGYENGRKIYETSVTYWMPFVDDSIGFHDATWQPRFGGSMYANGYGSHGCVNLSYDAARELYGLIHIDDVVVTHF